MKLEEARRHLKEVQGHSQSWLKAWGLSTIKEAIYTVRDRINSSKEDLDLAEDVERKIYDY